MRFFVILLTAVLKVLSLATDMENRTISDALNL